MAKTSPKEPIPAAPEPPAQPQRQKRRKRKRQRRASQAKPGMPAFQPTAEQRRIVTAAAGFGLKQVLLAKLIVNARTGEPIDAHTLRKHFREELDTGIAKTHFNVGKSLYDQAVGIPQMSADGKTQIGWITPPSTTAGIWFSKAKMGWKDRTTLEVADLEAIVRSFGGNLESLRAARAAGDTGESDQ